MTTTGVDLPNTLLLSSFANFAYNIYYKILVKQYSTNLTLIQDTGPRLIKVYSQVDGNCELDIFMIYFRDVTVTLTEQ